QVPTSAWKSIPASVARPPALILGAGAALHQFGRGEAADLAVDLHLVLLHGDFADDGLDIARALPSSLAGRGIARAERAAPGLSIAHASCVHTLAHRSGYPLASS